MIIVAGNRKVQVGRGLLLLVGSAAATAGFLSLAGLGAMSVMIVLSALYPVVWVASKPLSRLIARLGFSVRWKFEFAIAAISALFLLVSLVNYGAMGFMHTGVHDIKHMIDGFDASETRPPGSGPGSVREALHDLENKQHNYLFRLTPILGSLGILVAATLGAAMAWSVIVPVRRMGESMDRIGAGDFAKPVEVDNRDEMGELADQINDMTGELEQLQKATLDDERARALRERMNHVTMAEEEERRRISRELHDGLGPSLAAIGNRIRAAKHTVTTDPQETERQLDEIATSVKGQIQEIRELIHDLRPLALDQLGLKGAIEQQVDRLRRDTGIDASFTTSGEADLASLAEVTAFRVVQECLTNVRDHSGAGKVSVDLSLAGDRLEVRVDDDGAGFDPQRPPASADGKGLGLFGMRERAEALGGNFSLTSSPGKGCLAVLSIPSSGEPVGIHPSPAS